MASRREYDMLFQLSAQMNGNFAGTFSKAQQQLLSFQKEIQELNKTQGDISAYEKQQQAVESTKKKLETLQQQYDNIQREIQETGGFSSDLENKLLSKQQQIDKTSASLERQTQKLDQMGASLREAGVDTGNLGKETERLGAEVADLKKKQEEAAESAKSFGQESNQAITAVGDALAAAGIAAALHEIYEAYMECISVAGNFEESMSNVEALSGASTDELRQLSDLAKELGATTKFTAKESADAMGYMAMAGWDAQQMLSGMPGVLQLAAASGEDLAQVSDIVTDSMTAFGLTAADTSHYADVLAATAASANTSVGIMGETFKYAAPVAGALGYSIEDVSTAIGLMANAGIKGSNAGTALRNVFNGLLTGVTLTSEAFGEAEVSAVQADGTMADFGTTINELRGYFSQMSDAERVNNAMVIAGQRGYAGLLSILNATDADYAKLTANINNATGAAQRMADIKMDNMNGQLTLLNSAWEAVQTTVGEQFTPALADLYGWGAKVLSEINSFMQQHPGVIKAVTAFVGVIGAVTAGIAAYSAVTKIAIPLMKLFTASIPGVNIIAGVTLAVAALTAGIVALSAAQDAEAAEVRSLTESSRQEYAQIQDLKAEYDEVSATYGENSEQAMYLAWRIDDLTASYEANKQTLADYIAECDELNKAIGEDLTSIRDSFDGINQSEGTTLALVHRLQELAAQTDQTVETQEEMKAIIKELNEVVPDLALSYEDVVGGVTDYAAAIEASVKAQAAMERYQAAQEGMVKAYNDQYTAQQKLNEIEDQRAAAQERYNKASDDYYEYLQMLTMYDTTGMAALGAIFSSQHKELKAAEEALADYDEQWEAVSATVQDATAVYEECNAQLVDYIEETETGADSSIALAEAITSVTEKVDLLTAAYNEAYDAAYASITGQYALWDEADEVVATSAETIIGVLESQLTYWNDYNANLESLRSRASDIEGLSDVIASFADGSNESVNAVAGMASATDEDLAAMVQNWRDLQQAQSETSDVIAEFKTDFTNQMDELTQQLQSDIEALDMSADAAESGRATIQAFIDSAYDMEPSVRAAYASLGRAAARAMSSASGTSVTVNGRGYAIGTNYAEAGLALVGENGPELMMMQGGEKILTAAETRKLQEEYIEAMMLLPELFKQIRGYAIGTNYAAQGFSKVGEQGPEVILGAQIPIPHFDAEEAIPVAPGRGSDGGGYVVTFSPVYNISGDMPSDELLDILREHDEHLKEQLEELLDEIEMEKARRAYR